MTPGRALAIWAGLAGVALVVLLASLMLGSVPVSLGEIGSLLLGHDAGLAGDVVWRLRLPRALAAFACGGLLAVAGTLMQTLLRNPLADPYVLGISGGAGVAALASLALMLPFFWVQTSAFAGALAAIAIVMALSHRSFLRPGEQDSSTKLLLTGVMMAAGFGALATLILTLAPDASLRGMLFWLTGDLNGVDRAALPLIALAVTLLIVCPVAHRLNVLLRGEAVAQAVGVAVGPLRARIYLAASLATAVAVTTAGSIGFIGLVVPHILRLRFGNDQRMLLPAAALAGGALLMLADLVARTIIAPTQLPVGVITAMIGVPVFLWLLSRRAIR
ncbi:FecCD family ABC transporter permease [Pandoraea apista]|uniref:Iron ABC transporter permease n=1 Tax=Pandoraea apista TaxID=93218 RepID=A0ABX9ZI90_9BURK|nr:iron ABC transporter permease [Pandoraea apista]PTD98413.1 ABC transporter permease [Pandoraea apista]RRJ26442.1 iron ABC transporter permease [Pandoraea apista]RRJ72974.1 iron ABC transporter permease [Pandoraea apista]RSC97957.1 iron ABC transporter permease [Pandoraea apista]RSD08926.1 iron ABC transporter permease [Pandoraea apista]